MNLIKNTTDKGPRLLFKTHFLENFLFAGIFEVGIVDSSGDFDHSEATVLMHRKHEFGCRCRVDFAGETLQVIEDVRIDFVHAVPHGRSKLVFPDILEGQFGPF